MKDSFNDKLERLFLAVAPTVLAISGVVCMLVLICALYTAVVYRCPIN